MTKRRRIDPMAAVQGGPAGRGPFGYLVMAVLVMAMVVVFAWRLWTFAHAPVDLPVLGDAAPKRPAAMPRPELAAATALPDAAAIAALGADARTELAKEPFLPLWAAGADAFTLAWGEAALAADGATPVTVGARDLATHGLRPGAPVRVVGAVVERDAGETDGWHRLVLSPEPDGYLEVVARPPLPAVGARVAAVGRYLGADDLPVGDGVAGVPAVLAATIAPAPEDDAARFADAPGADDPLWAELDDERLFVEPRPYYALLDRVRRDPRAATPPPSANANAYPIHADPAKYRGQPFTVIGTVMQAWEDDQVARDRPFGIGRVVRVILHQRDWSPFSSVFGSGPEAEEAKKRFTEHAGVLTLRLYELAIPGDQPLPKRGDRLTAQGRFLKFLARPAQPDPKRTVKAVSDRVYTIMLVADSWQPLDDRAGLKRWGWGIGVVGSLFMALLIVFTWRQWREWRTLKAQLRAAAEQRRRTAGDHPA